MDVTSYLLGKKAGGGGDAPTGTIDITENGTYNVSSYASADVDVQPDLESKSITIDTNTTTTITPTQGKDGLSSVEVTTAVPQPSGKIEITQNGTDIDVSSYASADVSVSGSSYAPRTLAIWVNAYTDCPYTDITNEVDIDASNLINCYSTFSKLQNVTAIDISAWNNTSLSSTANMFNGCQKVKTILMPNISVVSGGSANNMFNNCKIVEKIDARNFLFSTLDSYGSNSMLTNVPTNCLIIVKDAIEKSWFATNFSSYTNVKTVAEYEGS